MLGQCLTDHAMRKASRGWLAATLVLLATGVGRGSEPESGWPPFLASPVAFPADVADAVRHVWMEPTLHRTLDGLRAGVPIDVYVAFMDTPDVTAAAARFLGLARYDVTAVGNDVYRAADGEGADGFYRVLVPEGRRRVVLSWGEHSSRLLGVIRGSALTVLDTEPDAGGVRQHLTVYVRIDNTVAAFLAKLLLPLFGRLVDRKLAEGTEVTAAVARWALRDPSSFCAWLARSGIPAIRRERAAGTIAGCGGRDGRPMEDPTPRPRGGWAPDAPAVPSVAGGAVAFVTSWRTHPDRLLDGGA
jgi:hypothetical protein